MRRYAGANEVWSCSTVGRKRREPSHLVRVFEKGNLIEMYTSGSVNLHENFYDVTLTPRVTEHGHLATATRIYTTLSLLTGHLNTKMAIIGTIIQVSLLIVNAIAILNEERFLAKSELLYRTYLPQLN